MVEKDSPYLETYGQSPPCCRPDAHEAPRMFPSLQLKLDRFEELERRLQEPDVLANPALLVEVQKEYGGLRKVAESVRAHLRLEADLAGAREMLELETDPESRDYVAAEVAELEQKFAASQTEMEDLATRVFTE